MGRKALTIIALLVCALVLHAGRPHTGGASVVTAERSESRVHDRLDTGPGDAYAATHDGAHDDGGPARPPQGRHRLMWTMGAVLGATAVVGAAGGAGPASTGLSGRRHAPSAGRPRSAVLLGNLRC